MNRCNGLMVILPLLSMTACGDPPPPRIEVALPDRAQFRACLADELKVPDNLPPYEAFTLPDGRQVVLLDRVRQRDKIQATFLVQTVKGREACRAAVVYVDQWTARMTPAVP